MKTSELLELAFSKIDTEEKWTKGCAARNKEYESCSPVDPYAICFCSIGAIRAVVGDEGILTVTRLVSILESVIPDRQQINLLAAYNDYVGYPEIAALWKAAIAKAKQLELNA